MNFYVLRNVKKKTKNEIIYLKYTLYICKTTKRIFQMAIAANKDEIDEKLSEMYFDKVTVNLDSASKLDPEVFWNQMTMVANNYKATMNYRLAW